jgi:RNA polymerase sigma-70 factor (ECF subfamily)
MFNEGYSAHTDPELVRSELCDEAILLADRLSRTSIGEVPETHALLSLMLLHSSRLPARVSPEGSLCLLEDQDRSLWDRSRIAEGMRQLSLSANGTKASPYHYEASVAAAHALAPSFEETDWRHVLQGYDDLAAVTPTAIVLLNRAIALAMVYGPQAGLAQVEAVESSKLLETYYLLPATKAKFFEMLGSLELARGQLVRALEMANNPCEVAFLRKKLASLTDG